MGAAVSEARTRASETRTGVSEAGTWVSGADSRVPAVLAAGSAAISWPFQLPKEVSGRNAAALALAALSSSDEAPIDFEEPPIG